MKKSVVVIGAGLAGSILCNELAKKADVTLLELGDKDVISYPKIRYIKKKLAGVKTFCYGGGGTTNLWHNGLIPINTRDVTSDNFRHVLTEAKPYTDKAASKLNFPDKSYLAEYENAVSEMNSEAEKSGVFSEGVDCLLYPKSFKKLSVDPEVNVHYRVKNIKFESVGSRISKVSFYVGDKLRKVDVDDVVFSAGTFGTPRLVEKVMASVGEKYKQVGRGLIDHPLGFVGKVKFKKSMVKTMQKFALLDKDDYESCTAARYKSDCGQYTCFAFFRPALTMSNSLSIYKYKSLLGASSGVERLKNVFSFKIFHPDILAEIFAHIFGMNVPTRIFNVLFYFEQKRGDSSVAYDGETLVVDWSITGKELAVYNKMMDTVKTTLSPVSDEINIQTDITEDWVWSGAHHSGTVSLGNSSVDLVDNDLKLRCCDNVYVCDGSIIQENSYANTGLTIAQLALRLVDRIV